MSLEKIENLADTTQDFDGELVVIAKGEFCLTKPFKSVIATKEGKGRGSNSISALKVISNRYNLQLAEGDRQKTRKLNTIIKNNLDYLRRHGWDEDILQIVLEGKIKLSFLIDSCGGDTEVLDIYRDSIDSVKERGGKTQAYVTQMAASAAFDVMAETDEAYVLDSSLLMWHLSKSLTDNLNKDEKMIEIDDLEFFLEKVKGDYGRSFRERVLTEVKANPHLDYYYKAQELAEAGIVERCFQNVVEMQSFFSGQSITRKIGLVKEFWG